MREVAASGGAMAAASAVHLSIFGVSPLVFHGSEEQKLRYLPKVVSGEMHVAFAVTEPDAGNDITHIKTAARRDGDNYIINGRKGLQPPRRAKQNACSCSPVRRPSSKSLKNRRHEPVLRRARAVSRRNSRARKTRRAAVDTNLLFIDNLKVSASDLIGGEGRGFHCLLDGLNPERILVAAEAIGIGRAAIAKAVRYAKERVVFGRPIGQNQAIAHPLADSYSKLEAANS